MRAKTVKTFYDLKAKKVRKKGDIFEVSKKRFEEINSTSGTLIKEIKETKGDGK